MATVSWLKIKNFKILLIIILILDDNVELEFNHDGYLFLASKKSAQQLYDNHKVQL